jgi:gamma-glutamyltranspeptidase / glutathione hydrolase
MSNDLKATPKYPRMRLTRAGAVIVLMAMLSAGESTLASAGAISAHGMVVTAQHLASNAGLTILKEGGNAADAAVAVGFAEAVVNPCCGNIGGGGFMLLHLKSRSDIVINFRETAPAHATAAMYQDASGGLISNASLLGFKAVAVPGTVNGLDLALRKYGRLSRARVLAPAIRLAREGYILTAGDADILASSAAQFRSDPQLARIFLHPDGSPLRAGDRLVQSDLAKTLAGIAGQGPDYFYKGPLAGAVVAASARAGGILTSDDFANYRSEEMQTLHCSYRGYDVISVPPPSSGGVSLCEILNVLEGYDLKSLGFHTAAATRVMIEAMRRAYIDRNDSLGDPNFVDNPLTHLLSKQYAAAIRKDIDKGSTPAVIVNSSSEKSQTTHYSIIDKDGNAASVTYTLNGPFGALVMAPGSGVLLNDEMDDFTTKPGAPNQFGLVQGVKNTIVPGKRPLSSMSPTIILKDGRPVLILGSPGGSRIITATLEAAINVIDYGMPPQAAVDAPRIHFQAQPDAVFLEPGALSNRTREILAKQGYRFVEQQPWCAVELIKVDGAGLTGANDYRRPAGSAAGY